MRPEAEARYNPEAQPNPYSQIPDLVHSSLFAKPKDARRAQNGLLTLVQGSEFFDPSIIAIANIQKEIVNLAKKAKTPKDTTKIKPALELLHTVLMQGTGAASNGGKNLTLRLTQDVLAGVEEIEKNNAFFKSKKYLSSAFPEDLQNLENFLPVIRNAHKNNLEVLQITVKARHIQGEELTEINQFQKWVNTVGDIRYSRDDPKFQKKDGLIDLLRQEPNANFEGKEKLYNRKYAEISLEDVEQMDYPLSKDNFIKITNFLISAFSDNSDNLYLDLDKDLISKLFFEETLFYDISGPLPIKNKKLLANLNSWQEYFAYCILFEETIDIDLQVGTLLNKIPHTGNLAEIIYFSTNPLETDPDGKRPVAEVIDHHPVLAEAFIEFSQNYSPDELEKMAGTKMYVDEIGAEYLVSTVITRLEKRLNALGVSDKFKQEVEKLKTFVKETPYSKLHLDVIQQVFEKNCGQEFLNKLNNNSGEILEVTKSVWEDAIDKMHFLPMEEGENVVEFSQDSVPSLLGLKSISMTRIGTPQDWNISASFTFENTVFELYAVLNKNGELECKAPIEQEIPGLYAMLNHITVLTFHDLVVQERKEKETGTGKTTARDNGQVVDVEKDRNAGERKSYPRDLPRTQQDRKLISDAYEATNRTPRRVELHDRFLPGAREYQSAVDLYQEAVTGHVSEDTMHWTIQELEEAKKKAFKISEEKRLSVPAKFRLPTILDPLTGEERHLKTWVVEHSNPKPTQEELKSPVKLYQRYYKNSSALASLDQMKPWFVGQ